MLALEKARTEKLSGSAMARQAFERPSAPVRCARCGGETTRRKWGVYGIVFVDVCDDYDCRGVWLDEGAGGPTLTGAVAHFDCRLAQTTEFGSHTIIIGEIVEALSHPARPLVYAERGFHRLPEA